MKAYLPSLKANRKGRARGQTAIMEVGLAAALTAALAGTLVTSQQRYTKAQIAITAGDQHTRLAAAAASYVQSNYIGFVKVFAGGNPCGGSVTNGVASYPLENPLPSIQVPGTSCGSITSMIPAGAQLENAYRQRFQLVVTQTTPPAGPPLLNAILTTTGGTQIPDNIAGIVMRRIGAAGAMLPSPQNQAMLGTLASGNSGQFQLDPAAWGNAITPGRPLVYLNYQLARATNQNLERFSSGADITPNKMNASLYLSGVDSATGGSVNLALSGPAIPAGSAAANTALAGAGVQPRNAVLGARQVDTQTLTAGSSVGNPWTNNVAQAADEIANSRTVNDSFYAKYAGHTILANANLNVTSGYRLSATDGIHVTATAQPGANGYSTIANDYWQSPNGPPGSNPYLGNGTGGQPVIGVPGITWDAAGKSGLQAFYAQFGANPTGQFWIGTWKGDASGVVGFEADGGMRSPIYYDSSNAGYYVCPTCGSHLGGDVSVDNNVVAGRDVGASRNIWAGNISGAEGYVWSGHDVLAGRDVVAQRNIYAVNDITSGNNVQAAGNLVVYGNGWISQNFYVYSNLGVAGFVNANYIQAHNGGNACLDDATGCTFQISNDGGFTDNNDGWITLNGARGLRVPKSPNGVADYWANYTASAAANFQPLGGPGDGGIWADGQVTGGRGIRSGARANPNDDCTWAGDGTIGIAYADNGMLWCQNGVWRAANSPFQQRIVNIEIGGQSDQNLIPLPASVYGTIGGTSQYMVNEGSSTLFVTIAQTTNVRRGALLMVYVDGIPVGRHEDGGTNSSDPEGSGSASFILPPGSNFSVISYRTNVILTIWR